MNLSRSSEYAINVALQLARANPDEPVSCAWLAREGKLPQRYLQHILRRLVKHGIVHSTRGVEGGYVLAHAPHRITLLNIVEAVDMSTNTPSNSIRPLEPDGRARLAKALQNAARAVNAELENVTVADLVGRKKNARRSRR
jgi:Rrf2 family protein